MKNRSFCARAAAALLLAVLTMALMLFSACSASSGNAEYPLTVNGTPLDSEIFMYYLNEVFSDTALTTKEERLTAATNLCIRYVAINSTFESEGLSLTSAKRAEVSNDANVLWDMFGEYYNSIGVSKQTFIKINYSEEYKESLRLAYFDADGLFPVSDAVIRGYLAENYAAFKLIRGYLFTTDVYGNTIQFTEDELSAMLEKYETAAEAVNAGTSMEIMYASLADGSQLIQQSLKTEVIDENNHYYPASFYSTVKKMNNGEAKVCVFDDYIYLVLRVDITQNQEIFEEYRSVCLKGVSEIPLQNKISELCASYTSVRRSKLVEKYYDRMLKIKGE